MALRPDEPQTPGQGAKKRRSAFRGIAFIAIAATAALAAAVLLTRYMDSRMAAAWVPTSTVVVAALDIPVANPIQPEWLTLVEWPASSLPPGAVSDPATLVGRVAVVPITRGEALLTSKVVVAGTRSGLATLVPVGARAVAVRVDDVVGVAGFIHPGDSVDVIATMQSGQTTDFASKVILQNVKVLAVGKEIEHRGREADKAVPVTVATLMVTPEEAERLALAATKGQVLLALRGLGDEDLVLTRGVSPTVLLASGVPQPAVTAVAEKDKQPQRRAVVRAAPTPKKEDEPAAEKKVVEILRGDMFEKRDFSNQPSGKRP